VQIPDFPDHDNILRQFVNSHLFVSKGNRFLDILPGNTLIKKELVPMVFLVDLNRMNFHDEMDLRSG
jgi:hypothetical protein